MSKLTQLISQKPRPDALEEVAQRGNNKELSFWSRWAANALLRGTGGTWPEGDSVRRIALKLLLEAPATWSALHQRFALTEKVFVWSMALFRKSQVELHMQDVGPAISFLGEWMEGLLIWLHTLLKDDAYKKGLPVGSEPAKNFLVKVRIRIIVFKTLID